MRENRMPRPNAMRARLILAALAVGLVAVMAPAVANDTDGALLTMPVTSGTM